MTIEADLRAVALQSLRGLRDPMTEGNSTGEIYKMFVRQHGDTLERALRDAALRAERDELYRYVKGLLGLLQLVRGRDDMPAAISEVLNTNHRATDAAAYLTQILPPLELSRN